MRTDSVLCLNPQGVHRMVYHEWGSADNSRVLLCVHGLARNSRDFDDLAKALSRDYRVVCPDIVGRGHSDWLPNGGGYEISQYLQDLMVLIGRLNVEQVDWVGTSMGGILGMALASMANSPVRALVLNDIGAFIPSRSLKRIAGYLGDYRFESLTEVEQFMRRNYLALRNLEDHQWRHLARHGSRARADGTLALHYDPAISAATAAAADEDIDLWPIWRSIRCPQALLWGDRSDVLDAATVAQMQQENPELEVLQLSGIEHAPSLMEPEHIQWVQDWLRRHRQP